MFQYTSETIINSNEGNLILVDAVDKTKGVRIAAVGKDGKAATVPAEATLIIDGVTAVKAEDIACVYHTAYADPEMAQVVVAMPDSAEGDIITLRVYLSEQGRSSSILQNALLHKNRPFTYSIKSSANKAKDSQALAKQIKAEMLQTDFKFFKATAGETDLTLDALDCYVRFVDKYGMVVPAGKEVAEMIVVDPLNPAAPVDPKAGTVTKFGSEGAGTVAHLIKDLRIPTSASTDPFHGDHGGMPIPGGQYDQYLIEVVTDRRHVGHNVMGALGQSLTSFVLFVEKNGDAKTALTGAFTNLSITPLETESDFAKAAVGQDVAEGDLTQKVPAGVGNIG